MPSALYPLLTHKQLGRKTNGNLIQLCQDAAFRQIFSQETVLESFAMCGIKAAVGVVYALFWRILLMRRAAAQLTTLHLLPVRKAAAKSFPFVLLHISRLPSILLIRFRHQE